MQKKVDSNANTEQTVKVGKAKIYTKTGDKGTTVLVDGKRVRKSHLRLEAYGSVDELNSCIGVCIAEMSAIKADFLPTSLAQIQHRLFNVGSLLACEDAGLRKKLPSVTENDVQLLETDIDKMSGILPELKEFILPGGITAAAHLQLARTIARRTERVCYRLEETESVEAEILVYLNRLSDFLFVAARYTNHLNQMTETHWKK